MGWKPFAIVVGVAGIAIGCPASDENSFENKYLSYCAVDSSKSGFVLAADYDDCIGMYAQMTTADIPPNEISVEVSYLPSIDFYSARARLSSADKWVHGYYTFVAEDVSSFENSPTEINGVVPLKIKTKESIDKAFGFHSGKSQGMCSDVQEIILDNVLNGILSSEEKSRYLKQGKRLKILPDEDLPPLDTTTNPSGNGGVWMSRDPASWVTENGDSLSYSPPAFYAESDDPTLPPEMDEGLKGVRYCKLLSHQLILHWMLIGAFEPDALPVAPSDGENCPMPSSFDAPFGSCVFFFPVADSYYCSDYTGYGFDKESAMRKCASRASNDVLVTEYSEKPCDERMAEIESKIPDYAGFQGLCMIHCQEEGEFLWNIYQENPEPRCADYPFLSPAEKDKLLSNTE